MSDDVSVVDAQTTQEPVQTAAPAPEISTPEDNQQQATKTFTQEELDAIVGKRLAREQRKWEREQQLRMQELQAKAPAELPSADQFESVEAYAEALATQKAEELLSKKAAQQREQEAIRAYYDREEEAMDKYDDYKQVVYNPNIPISQVMAETIRESHIGPDLAYYLGSNPQEAHRISQLPPYLQAKEIGKLELKFESNPPAKKTSSAPAPINPITPTGSGGGRYDTTDPRSIKTMTASEWIEAENQRMMKKLQSQRY
jgi:hypothetical protein